MRVLHKKRINISIGVLHLAVASPGERALEEQTHFKHTYSTPTTSLAHYGGSQ